MIEFFPPLHRGANVMPDGHQIQFVDLPTLRRRDPSTKLLVGQTYFLTAIKTIIIGGRFDPLALVTQRGHQYAFGDQQMVIDAVSQMRQIHAAKRPMPITAIALATIQMIARRIDNLLAAAFFAGGFVKQFADVHHARVHLVGLGILHLEVAPKTARHELLYTFPLRMRFEFVYQIVVIGLLGNRHRPFGHLAVTGVGQIDFAFRGSRRDSLL